MREIKHTPGPWAEDSIDLDGDMKRMDTRDCGYTRIRGANGDLVVADIDVSTPDGMANARLIAAAPELLETLIRMQIALGQFCCSNCITEQDLEDGGDEILIASRAADTLIARMTGNHEPVWAQQ
jgi:hypothetical protein